MYIEQLYTNCLAEAAYYIESEGEAAIVDPLRDIQPYMELAKKRKAKIRYIFETHFHADFVSGHIDLSIETGAPIIFGPTARPEYQIYNAKDGEHFSLGGITIKTLHTPGHTPESSCYLVKDESAKDYALFTGDTLFVGDVGRPDLLDGIMTKEELAAMMFDSLNEKIKPLADEVIIYPAHGAGSACGKNISKETFSTIGAQKETNYALKAKSKKEFVDSVTAGMFPPPKYFYEDVMINKKGYNSIEVVLERSKAALDPGDVLEEVEKGALILDTRTPEDFQKGYIKGSINIGLMGQYAIWVGTLLEFNQPLILVTEPGKEEEAILRLARVGFENVLGVLQGGIDSWPHRLNTITSVDPKKFLHEAEGKLIIDVRTAEEFNAGHVEGAKHVTLSNMPANLKKLKKNETYLIYCAGGYRSMIAASIMRKENFSNVINGRGGFNAIKQVGVQKVNEVPQ